MDKTRQELFDLVWSISNALELKLHSQRPVIRIRQRIDRYVGSLLE
jgi:hypothetical protein